MIALERVAIPMIMIPVLRNVAPAKVLVLTITPKLLNRSWEQELPLRLWENARELVLTCTMIALERVVILMITILVTVLVNFKDRTQFLHQLIKHLKNWMLSLAGWRLSILEHFVQSSSSTLLLEKLFLLLT